MLLQTETAGRCFPHSLATFWHLPPSTLPSLPQNKTFQLIAGVYQIFGTYTISSTSQKGVFVESLSTPVVPCHSAEHDQLVDPEQQSPRVPSIPCTDSA